MKIKWLCGAILTLYVFPLFADTYPRQSGVDVQHYVFRLSLLTDDSNEIQGEARVTLRLKVGNLR